MDSEAPAPPTSTGEAPGAAELSSSHPCPRSSVFLYLKSALVQAAGQLSWASWTVASVLPPAPSPGCPQATTDPGGAWTPIILDRMGSASHQVSVCHG